MNRQQTTPNTLDKGTHTLVVGAKTIAAPQIRGISVHSSSADITGRNRRKQKTHNPTNEAASSTA